jgi:guanidinoacetate N-methyltransferase
MTDTVQTRLDIGFPAERVEWAHSDARYDEHTLRIAGHPVMEDWERPYMRRLAEIATSLSGTVLEVGYGLGLSAAAIQEQDIDHHVVVECHPDVMAHCIRDCHEALANNRLHLFGGFWQEVVPLLADESFDGILFDTYPLTPAEIHRNHYPFLEQAHRLLRPGGVFTYYSDEANELSEGHRAALIAAGFNADDIAFELCSVEPPADCEYWTSPTIVAPIIRR